MRALESAVIIVEVEFRMENCSSAPPFYDLQAARQQ